jgi:serine/threonine protein phosphatase PrpC
VGSAEKERTSVFGAAIQGKRSEQQDSFNVIWLQTENAWLLLLADGMGGHAGGGLASRLAVEQFNSAFAVARAAGMNLKQSFEAALERTNTRIAAAAREQSDRENMGTTLVAAHLSHEGLAWVSVGDSPLWLYRGENFYRLNEDHSLRALARDGARVSGNMLQSAVTGAPIEIIDYHATPVALHENDLIVLASDGLLTLEEEAIAGEVGRNASSGAQSVIRALLNAVEQRRKDNQDNCTVIVASRPPAVARNEASGSRSRRGRKAAGIFAAAVALLAALAAIYHMFIA